MATFERTGAPAVSASFFFVAANCAGSPYAKKKFGKQAFGENYHLRENTPGEHARSRNAGVQ